MYSIFCWMLGIVLSGMEQREKQNLVGHKHISSSLLMETWIVSYGSWLWALGGWHVATACSLRRLGG